MDWTSIADHRRGRKVRFWGNMPNTPEELQTLVQTLAAR
jgi:hypothetical protein